MSLYRARQSDFQTCALEARCCPGQLRGKVPRSGHEPGSQRLRNPNTASTNVPIALMAAALAKYQCHAAPNQDTHNIFAQHSVLSIPKLSSAMEGGEVDLALPAATHFAPARPLTFFS
jgi:hypothetical protein